MLIIRNPFIINGYISPAYFCDRKAESEMLIRQITNGNNTALISTRRMGKTGLIRHCFQSKEIQKTYYTFFIDIYATKSLGEFVFAQQRNYRVIEVLGQENDTDFLLETMKSLQASLTFDFNGNPSFNLGFGRHPISDATLDEIFHYLEQANKPCIVAIDEFQQITNYAEDNVEVILRTYVQHCNNAHFIFAGSQRHIMGNIFLTASLPFLSECIDDASGKYSFRGIHQICSETLQRSREEHIQRGYRTDIPIFRRHHLVYAESIAYPV